MSLLSVIQSVCLRSGITDSPTFVIGNTDPTIAQLLEICREEAEELQSRHPWGNLQKEATFNTVAADLQGDLVTIASDFDRFIDDTEWNRAFGQPIGIPITPSTWQQLKARLASSPYYGMRIKQNPATYQLGVYLIPTPVAGQAVYFEYVSNLLWKPIVAGVPKTDCTLDTDTFMLPEKLLKSGIRWRWKKEKGLSYAEDFVTYERLVATTWADDSGGAPTLSINNAPLDIHLVDYTNVPDGNWQ